MRKNDSGSRNPGTEIWRDDLGVVLGSIGVEDGTEPVPPEASEYACWDYALRQCADATHRVAADCAAKLRHARKRAS